MYITESLLRIDQKLLGYTIADADRKTFSFTLLKFTPSLCAEAAKIFSPHVY